MVFNSKILINEKIIEKNIRKLNIQMQVWFVFFSSEKERSGLFERNKEIV